MEFQLYERKFKFLDDELYSFFKKGGRNQIEKWHIVKLKLEHGYKRFGFTFKGKSKHFQYHRVVYYAHNPDWNIYDTSKYNFIDHIDRIKTNNHISNLRNVTNQENGFNRKCKGYTFDKASGKYKATIKLNGKQIHIGYYNIEQEAREAYLRKKEELHIIPQRIHN
jgi:hypothetical protein